MVSRHEIFVNVNDVVDAFYKKVLKTQLRIKSSILVHLDQLK